MNVILMSSSWTSLRVNFLFFAQLFSGIQHPEYSPNRGTQVKCQPRHFQFFSFAASQVAFGENRPPGLAVRAVNWVELVGRKDIIGGVWTASSLALRVSSGG